MSLDGWAVPCGWMMTEHELSIKLDHITMMMMMMMVMKFSRFTQSDRQRLHTVRRSVERNCYM